MVLLNTLHMLSETSHWQVPILHSTQLVRVTLALRSYLAHSTVHLGLGNVRSHGGRKLNLRAELVRIICAFLCEARIKLALGLVYTWTVIQSY